jgi:hypothetical protein
MEDPSPHRILAEEVPMFPRARRILVAALIVLSVPAAARAVTLDDLIALTKAGVSAEILVAVIDADRTIFDLTTDEIVLLKKAGVPNSVIVKMLGTAREFVIEVPPPLIVGADKPSAPESSPVPTFMPAGPYFVMPYPVYFAPVVPGLPATNVRGFGRFMNDGSLPGRGFGRFMNDGFVAPSRPATK